MEKKHNRLFIVLLFLLLMTVSFFMGRISILDKEDKKIKVLSATAIRSTIPDVDIEIRASSRGSKYYFPWCPSSFSEENVIYFSNEEDAAEAGYELATDCLRPQN